MRDLGAIIEGIVDPSDVDREDTGSPAIVETAFGNASKHRHRTALEIRLATVAATALVAFVPAAGCLTVTASGTATNPLSLAVLLNAAMDIVEIHDENRFD